MSYGVKSVWGTPAEGYRGVIGGPSTENTRILVQELQKKFEYPT